MEYKKISLTLLLTVSFSLITTIDNAQVIRKSHKPDAHQNDTEKKSAPRSNHSSNSGSSVFNEGTLEVDLGLGFWGNYNYNYWDGYYWHDWAWNGWNGRPYNSFVSPSFHLAVDYGVKRLGPGTFGFGGALAIKTASWSLATSQPLDNDFDYFGGYVPHKERWTDIIIGLRGTYHLDLPKAPKFDLYFGLMLGARITQYHYSGYEIITWWPHPYTYKEVGFNNTRTYPVGGLFLGCKYYFTESVGMFGEIGWDVAALKLGVSFKM